MFKWFTDTFRAFFESFRRKEAPVERAPEPKTPPPSPVYFENCEVVEKTPTNASIGEKRLVSVGYQGKALWTLFRCPCGCGDMISLPMQAPHNPRWRLTLSDAGRPTLSPSVWRNKGCMSHFWIKDGRVYWTRDTGTEPWVARPDVYSKRV